MRRFLVVAVVSCLTIAGCAPTVWDKPGVTQAQFNQENARCRLVARGMAPGDFYAQGSAQFVAGAAIGNAIGTAIGQAANYSDCMMASGYTPEDPQTQANVAKVRPIMSQSRTCFSNLYASPEIGPIRRHVPLHPNEATSDQLSDRSFASDEEIVALNLLLPRNQQCFQHSMQQLSTSMPSLVSILAEQSARSADDLTQLRERRFTWGDYNMRRQKRSVEARAQLTAELRSGDQ
jgi:hypothetical protein